MLEKTKRTISLILSGFLMGSADIVPGVSGGTMAFILGIYEDLIDAIRLFGRRELWTLLFRGKWGKMITLPRWNVLLPLTAGILTAGLTLSIPLEYLLETQPEILWSFFFGLVLASVFVVASRIRTWKPQNIVALIAGCIFAYIIVGLVPVETTNAPWFLVVSGAIAICAMILPGISGSFLLVLLGKYEFLLSAVNQRDVLSLGYVGVGAALGIILFSQVLSWLFRQYHDMTVALLTGLMIGSLRKVWPWKVGDANVFPVVDAEAGMLFGLMIAGVFAVLIVEMIAAKK